MALPVVAVVHDLASADPVTVIGAARRLCAPVFVCDRERMRPDAAWPGAYATVIDVTGLGPDERAAAVAAVLPAGVVTFSEYQLAETARLAATLGLPGHAAATVDVLTDKFAQRRALAAAGVQPTRCAVVTDVDAAIAEVGLPAVVKPRVGAGSRHTSRVDTRDEFAAAVAAAGVPVVAEELLVGDQSVAGVGFGDYVSVESVHTPAGSRQVCVTGKFPLAEPFRETGMLLPSPLADESAVLALDAAATDALGIRHGIAHTEIKLTPDGPRVIEVNGRLGGYAWEILHRAGGPNLVAVALRLAMGEDPQVSAPTWRGVTYQVFLTPPAAGGVLVEVSGVDAVRALPGVRKVDVHAQPGAVVDASVGTQAHLGLVYGAAADHAGVLDVADSVRSLFRPVLAEAVGAPR
ncbi:hypothetical protein [Alloactinosynnema sp. L-07]|nr:hypothetical protein [Alloactinosynnema sp. L-07]